MIIDKPPVHEAFHDDNGSRIYETPVGYLPSVTSILSKVADNPGKKFGLKKWREKMGEERADMASQFAIQRGEALHKTVERFLLDDPNYMDSVPDNGVFLSFLQVEPFLRDLSEVIEVEAAIYHPRYKYAGRTDIIARVDGVVSIIDLKGSNKKKTNDQMSDYFLQCAAYAGAWNTTIAKNSEEDLVIEKGYILMAVSQSEEPIIKEISSERLRSDYLTFVHYAEEYSKRYPAIIKDGEIKGYLSGESLL